MRARSKIRCLLFSSSKKNVQVYKRKGGGLEPIEEAEAEKKKFAEKWAEAKKQVDNLIRKKNDVRRFVCASEARTPGFQEGDQMRRGDDDQSVFEFEAPKRNADADADSDADQSPTKKFAQAGGEGHLLVPH